MSGWVHRWLASGSAMGAAVAIMIGPSPASSAPLPATVPRATAYALTPLLTGGILETKREVTLLQSTARRQKDPDPQGCNPYADGQVSVRESTQVSGLIDLGYPHVPRATDATSAIPESDVRVSGSVTTQGAAWDCNGDPPRNFLAQGGTCSRTFTSPAEGGALIEPRPGEGYGDYYEPGVSRKVVGVTYYDAGVDCLMYDGLIPWAPGLFMNDYWWDGQIKGALSIPEQVAKQDRGTAEGSLAASDTSCASGGEWWNGAHGSAIYTWMGTPYGEEPPDDISTACSSTRTGFARTTIERALVINEVRVFQMTPAGDYREVGPTEKIVDGNTVKVDMLIENRWKKDVTAPIELWDTKYKRPLEPEKGQQNPVTETFMAGAQKKVTFLWRTDGVAWEGAQPVLGRDIDILTPYGGATFSVFTQPRPALLVHGWNSSAATWDSWPGFVGSTRDGWYVKAVVGMDTDPQTGRSIQQNAQYVARAIQAARTATGAVHVDLVVHSMGGLISRWYIGNLMGGPEADGRPLVRSLTMFGTPHLGSDCATGILSNVASSYVAKTDGRYSLTDLATNFTSGGRWIPTVQLTPAYLTGPFLAASTRPAKGVYYSHLTGNPIPLFACGIYGSQEGRNDGAVVVPSSIGGGLGGKPLSPPLPVVHITLFDNTVLSPSVFNGVGMTEERSFYDIALSKVLGLGPDLAPRLVSAGGSRSAAYRAASPEVARAVTVGGTRGSVGQTLTLTKPLGSYTLLIDAPEGTTVTTSGPGGSLASQPGGATITVPVSGAAGTISLKATGAVAGAVAAVLVGGDSWFNVTTRRQGASLIVSATVPGRRATTLEAVTVSGGTVGTVVRLKGNSGTYRASLPLPKGDAVLVLVKGTRGQLSRLVATSG